jgi:hypothetical protein
VPEGSRGLAVRWPQACGAETMCRDSAAVIKVAETSTWWRPAALRARASLSGES